MGSYDLCLAWNWEYDTDFVRLLEGACSVCGLSLLQVTPQNLDAVLAGLHNGETTCRALIDRASDSDSQFQPLVDWARRKNIFRINRQEQTLWAGDKATMHLEFHSRGLVTPYTIILSPYAEQPDLPQLDLSPLGGPFAIKPACGGGGWGVVLEATSIQQVHTARGEYPQEKLLLQAHVTPRLLDSRPAWFRVIYCAGAVYSCWWDPRTHVYTRVTAEDGFCFGLRTLREITVRIAGICRLDLFSTEIALTEDDHFIVVDYVNDPVDLRLQSLALDGVPDTIVENISGRLARLADRSAPHR